ncbi:hypothetical protein Tco_0671521 [Tanacetum coccineum]
MVVVIWTAKGRGRNKGGVVDHPFLKRAPSWCSIRLIYLWLAREEMRILALELIFTFPCELRSSSRIPMNFNNGNATLLKLLHLPVYDLHRFFDKMQLVIQLNLIKRDDKTLIQQTLLQI